MILQLNWQEAGLEWPCSNPPLSYLCLAGLLADGLGGLAGSFFRADLDALLDFLAAFEVFDFSLFSAALDFCERFTGVKYVDVRFTLAN
jgi:hypothetical protein